MLRRWLAVLTVSLLLASLAISSPVSALSPGKSRLVLPQSHQFEDMLPDAGGHKARFGSERKDTAGILTLTFSDSLVELAGEDNVSAEFSVKVPGNDDIDTEVTGSLEMIDSPNGAVVFGLLGGTWNDRPITLTLNHEPKGNQSWAIVSFGAGNDVDHTVVTYGTKHGLVDQTSKVYAEKEARKGSPVEDIGVTGLATAAGTVDSEGRGAVKVPDWCDKPESQYYQSTYYVAAQYSFGPASSLPKFGSASFGGRVFSNSVDYEQKAKCDWDSLGGYGTGYRGYLSISSASSILTAPNGYYGSGAYPTSSSNSGTIMVPVYLGQYLAWQLVSFSIPQASISATYSYANGSSTPNRLTHTWTRGSSTWDLSSLNYNPSVEIMSQNVAAGWNGTTLFQHQMTSSGSGLFCQRGKMRYVYQTEVGTYGEDVDSSDVCWTTYYTP